MEIIAFFFSALFFILLSLIGLAFYLAPTIIAIKSDHPNKAAIIVLNILGGWTFVIWLVALVWALTIPVASPAVAGGYQNPTNITVVQQSHMSASHKTQSNVGHFTAHSYGTPKMIGISGHYAGQVIDLSKGQVTIGRDPRIAQLAYPQANSRISRKHCIVQYDKNNQRFVVQDTSSNGTFIYPHERLSYGQPVYLEPGARIFLGDTNEQYELRIE